MLSLGRSFLARKLRQGNFGRVAASSMAMEAAARQTSSSTTSSSRLMIGVGASRASSGHRRLRPAMANRPSTAPTFIRSASGGSCGSGDGLLLRRWRGAELTRASACQRDRNVENRTSIFPSSSKPSCHRRMRMPTLTSATMRCDMSTNATGVNSGDYSPDLISTNSGVNATAPAAKDDNASSTTATTATTKTRKVTTLHIMAKKRRNEKITMVTAYDYPSAMHVDRAGIDIVLVGDSCAMVELGFETTLVRRMCLCRYCCCF
jgi:hypothetical protein